MITDHFDCVARNADGGCCGGRSWTCRGKAHDVATPRSGKALEEAELINWSASLRGLREHLKKQTVTEDQKGKHITEQQIKEE